MNKQYTLLLCIISAGIGAALTVGLHDAHTAQQASFAQEPSVQTASTASRPTDVAPMPQAEPLTDAELTPQERINVAVYEMSNRSAVNIMTESVAVDSFFLIERRSEGEGSGTVIDREGHILTNFHVVDGAREIQVTLYNGKTYQAEIIGLDPNTDVAVLKIDAPADVLYPVTFGTSTGLRVGQQVFAIGNPFGLERTLSTGIVSSLDRSLPRRQRYGTIKSIIQIDASINPGNSGGPLLDSHGRMIGMNTAIASRTGESAGVGFAIPINTIARIVPQLIQNGHISRASIGIAGVYQTEQGLLIAGLVPEGAAERAGLRGPEIIRRTIRQGPITQQYQTIDRSAADVIVALDDQPVRSIDDLLTLVEAKAPGDRVTVTVIRAGEQVRIPIELDESD